MKKVLSKLLLCILIVVIAGNFVLGSLSANNAYASFGATDTMGNLITGLIRTIIISGYINSNGYFNRCI